MEFSNEQFGIVEEELLQYQKNAIEVAFCNEFTKHEFWKLYH